MNMVCEIPSGSPVRAGLREARARTDPMQPVDASARPVATHQRSSGTVIQGAALCQIDSASDSDDGDSNSSEADEHGQACVQHSDSTAPDQALPARQSDENHERGWTGEESFSAPRPLRPEDPHTMESDRAILAAMIESETPGDASVAREQLIREDVLHESFTSESVLVRFTELCQEAQNDLRLHAC